MRKLVLYRLPMVFLFLASALLSLVGCGSKVEPYPKYDSYVVVMLNPNGPMASKLADRPTRIDVPLAATGRQEAMGDMVLTVPEGWRAENPPAIIEDHHGELGYGRVFSLPMKAGQDSGGLWSKVSYREEQSPLRHPTDGLLGAIRHGAPDPAEFLKQFATDLELQDAIYNTFPPDVMTSFGKKRERVLALLVLKSQDAHPITRYAAPNCVAYGFQDLGVPQIVLYGLYLFDKMGMQRGMVGVQLPHTVSREVAETTVRQILGGMSFTERPEPVPASVGESKR